MSIQIIKEKLLNLSINEKKERLEAVKDFLFYLGECNEDKASLLDKDLLGQSWLIADDLDYIPSQVIDNKVKPLINKQARFMFSKRPDLLFKPFNVDDTEMCEELRQYIDSIFSKSSFWSQSLKAFRLASITKRVLLRMEANPGESVKLHYHSINDFNYKVDPNDMGKLLSVTFVRQDVKTMNKDELDQLWYRYTYYMDGVKNQTCYLKVETFKGSDLENPIDIGINNTELTRIPCWVICNEQSLDSPIGMSDVKDLKPLQDSYNKRLSDFNDCLRFLMFGQTTIIDATEDTVNNSKIAPNAIMALESLEGDKQAKAQRVESNFTNVEPIRMYLQLLDDSMREKLAIPKTEELQKVPSAKTIKFIYTELVARCEEKWNDWEPIFKNVIDLIVEACSKFECYEDWKPEWGDLLYNVVIIKNYPIPEDEEDKKRLAMEEVQSHVRSHRSYIKDYSNDEDVKKVMLEICEDVTAITAAENEQYIPAEE